MNQSLYLRNRQRSQLVDTRFLRRLIRSLVVEDLQFHEYELGVYLVGTAAMSGINLQYLGHKGSTDVITFDYGDPQKTDWLAGDIFVSGPEAVIQARAFRTTWQQELARYIVHGLLHLQGYDDRQPVDRRSMKAAEERLVRKLEKRFRLARIAHAGRRA